ncbi:hypothetical protein QA584_08415 [Anaerocolumna sp. AGMB13025]|uniref:FtsX-like permease family protein n=1 Tax=Anaerocolumna sp. AGMB13025 TaxID=3039116 RepID=UPI00241F98D2|nr:FtsX-like permease family protein [Anaerocolumna sp. AGMB13025]WFR59095.1 hypothetical protein QA584_08415 [Anaerocolumna sp. AGMB13025]
MYLKLALRNAKRSIYDYLLYMTALTILIVIMMVSNYIAITGKVQAGFQTSSLPILITLILVILVRYINNFMLKQRAKEFANYLLLGMEKSKLSWMFLCEFLMIGIICFIIGCLIGIGIYFILFSTMFQVFNTFGIQFAFVARSLTQTLFYFCLVELLSVFCAKQRISNLQIRELMIEKKLNQKLGGMQQYRIWGITFCISFFILIGLLFGIVRLTEEVSSILISFIALPLLFSIFSFYKWLFQYFAEKRRNQSVSLYQNNRLYMIAQITSGTKTSAVMNGIFCMCLFFSAMSFMFGTLMLHSDLLLFNTGSQQWMGFLQISLCIIFIVIYFSVLSLQQIIELKRETKELQILHYIGKTKAQIKLLVKTQILLKLFIPTIMCFVLLVISVPLLNYKLNSDLPSAMENILTKSASGFSLCFFIMYFFYFFVVCVVSKKYVDTSINSKY